MKQEMVCTIHNVTFSCEENTSEKYAAGKYDKEIQLIDCPICVRKRIAHLIAENALLAQHRDALIEVIEIKQTVVRKS